MLGLDSVWTEYSSVCVLVWTDGYINMFYNFCYLVLIIIILVKLG